MSHCIILTQTCTVWPCKFGYILWLTRSPVIWHWQSRCMSHILQLTVTMQHWFLMFSQDTNLTVSFFTKKPQLQKSVSIYGNECAIILKFQYHPYTTDQSDGRWTDWRINPKQEPIIMSLVYQFYGDPMNSCTVITWESIIQSGSSCKLQYVKFYGEKFGFINFTKLQLTVWK